MLGKICYSKEGVFRIRSDETFLICTSNLKIQSALCIKYYTCIYIFYLHFNAHTLYIHWIIKKAREFQKNIYFCLVDYAKPSTMWITIDYGKF